MPICACEVENCILCDRQLFGELPEAASCQVRGLLLKQQLDPGDVLFSEGDAANYLYVLRSGQVKLISSNDG